MTMSKETDERISRLKNDPRFIRPKKKQTKLQVDSRFKPMFEAEDFQTPFKVDKYGRKVKDTSADSQDLKRFYRMGDEEEEKQGSSESDASEENEEDESSGSDSSSSEDDLKQPGDDSIVNILDDSLAQHPLVIRDVPMGSATARLAVVNLDWDQIKALDLFKMMEAFKPPAGVVKSVKIYPSEFGKERMAKEAIEGPPQDIFKGPADSDEDSGNDEDESNSESEPQEVSDSGSDSNDDSDDDDKGKDLEPLKHVMEEEGQDFNEIQLRKYQLERLRYFYAVVECDSVETASTIYRHCDGTEFEMSANFIDLRFIPDEVSFADDVPTDEADHSTKNYKPKPDMITPALQHSKVKLTWDLDDPDRSRLTRVNLAKFNHEENDLNAYLASASSEDDSEEEQEDKTAKAARMRELLLSGNDVNVFGRKSHEDNEDLQITFTSGFDNAKLLEDDDSDVHMEATFSASENEEAEEKRQLTLEEYKRPDETLFEARLRRQRETKKAKKEARLAKIEAIKTEEREKEDLRRRQAKKAKLSGSARADLSDADTEDEQDQLDEEAAGVQKTKKKWKSVRREKKGEDFQVKVDDDRFKAIYEEPSFSLDPTHPSFKPTKGNKELIRERQRRMK